MRLLIDSHALIWFCEGNPALSSVAREAMEDGANERFISHATPWEMAIRTLQNFGVGPASDVGKVLLQ